MTSKQLEDQRALVTGASSGIGAEIARLLAAHGADLVITARREKRLEALATEVRDEHGVEVKVIPSDLAEDGAVEALYEATEGAGHAVDILINNAGFGLYDDFIEIPWTRHRTMLEVNVVALTGLTRLFVPEMVRRGRGNVMNIASIAAYTPCPNFASYAASKAYVRNFTEALDYELEGTGVDAICVSPGGTRTEFTEVAAQNVKKSGEKFMMDADECARIAVEKMLAGRRNVVTGFLNALMMWMMRFVPRGWQPAIIHSSMSSAVSKAKQLPAE